MRGTLGTPSLWQHAAWARHGFGWGEVLCWSWLRNLGEQTRQSWQTGRIFRFFLKKKADVYTKICLVVSFYLNWAMVLVVHLRNLEFLSRLWHGKGLAPSCRLLFESRPKIRRSKKQISGLLGPLIFFGAGSLEGMLCSLIWFYIYIYMGAARFPGPPNLHDLQNWFKQLILQLPICICIVQHVTWEISLPSFIESVQGVRSAPHRSFTLHKVFQRLVKEKIKLRLSRQVITEGAQSIYEIICEFHAAVLKFVILI